MVPATYSYAVILLGQVSSCIINALIVPTACRLGCIGRLLHSPTTVIPLYSMPVLQISPPGSHLECRYAAVVLVPLRCNTWLLSLLICNALNGIEASSSSWTYCHDPLTYSIQGHHGKTLPKLACAATYYLHIYEPLYRRTEQCTLLHPLLYPLVYYTSQNFHRNKPNITYLVKTLTALSIMCGVHCAHIRIYLVCETD